MNSIIELVLRVAGLVEAEGRVARRSAIRIVLASCVWLVATILLAVGLLAIAVAIFIALADTMHPAAALLVVALIVIVAAAGFALAGHQILLGRERTARKRMLRPQPQPQPQL